MTRVPGDRIENEAKELDSVAGGWAFEPCSRQLFKRAGWQPMPRPAPLAAGDAVAYATLLLEEFGGLNVGESGAGIDCAAGDIQFLRVPESVRSTWVSYWPRLSVAVWIAIAHDTYADVLVDANGDFLVVTEMDERLYNFGSNFVRFAETLLRGLEWPQDVEDAP